MKLKGKLLGGFLSVAAMTLAVGFIGWWGLASTDDALREVAMVRLPSVVGLTMMNDAQTQIQNRERSLLIPEFFGNEQEKTYFLKQIETAWQTADKGRKIYEALAQTPAEAELWKRLVPAWDEWKTAHSRVIELLKDGKREDALAVSVGKGRDTFRVAAKLLDDLIALDVKVADAFSAQALPRADRAQWFGFAGMVLGTLLAVALGIGLSASATRPIVRVVSGLTDGADQVASAASHVSGASQHLAEGASEQAAGIEETSSALEEMTSMIKQNSENASEANELMRVSNGEVTKAVASMEQLTDSMMGISNASEETQKIIKTIDEIAFQTNLLALNAAVEAARAGEAGAGFAVVADEVRNLAMRAADAARNTAVLIEETVNRVRDGVGLVAETNETFARVAKSTTKVGELVNEIAAASREQAQGAEQINTAIADMDKVVQQNAANAEETASASEQLNAQAGQMMGYVGELAKLVGTVDAGRLDGERQPRTEQGTRPGERVQTIVTRTADKAESPARGKALPKPGNGATRPEDVIPFDEDDMRDF